MNNKLSSEELNFLSRKGLYSEIARIVPSPRAQKPGATVSAYYVSQVLKRNISTDTETTQAIYKHAKRLLKSLLISNEA